MQCVKPILHSPRVLQESVGMCEKNPKTYDWVYINAFMWKVVFEKSIHIASSPGLNNEVQDSPVTDEFCTWCCCNFWKRSRSDFIWIKGNGFFPPSLGTGLRETHVLCVLPQNYRGSTFTKPSLKCASPSQISKNKTWIAKFIKQYALLNNTVFLFSMVYLKKKKTSLVDSF